MVEKLWVFLATNHAAICTNIEHPRVEAIPREIVCETVGNEGFAPCRQSNHDDEELLAACVRAHYSLFWVSIDALEANIYGNDELLIPICVGRSRCMEFRVNQWARPMFSRFRASGKAHTCELH
jgi:hypothetical protein